MFIHVLQVGQLAVSRIKVFKHFFLLREIEKNVIALQNINF